MGKMEEHEVRLGLALARLSRNEDRIQNCLERLERQPGAQQLRTMWREDIQREWRDVDVEELRRQVDQQTVALDEVYDHVFGGQVSSQCRPRPERFSSAQEEDAQDALSAPAFLAAAVGAPGVTSGAPSRG
eukprot:TRINITY_DN71660_c0_g1_i1.p2 TRINITY_DN71660_c0_g1~~TRINITY_DN71660_c0_g1_i1.p2  ORF type:complete len:131 (+),score=35.99 TRINITY_DN71660_c0_g1_i1:879-1271(+)